MHTVCWLFVSIFLSGIILECSSTEPVSCHTKFKDIQSARFVCPKTECANQQVWGTVNYTSDSRICAAAWHDGRIKPWSTNAEERTVTWSSGTAMSRFVGTTRYGKSSELFEGLYETRFFTSDRVSESLYNISIIVDPEAQTISCFGRGNTEMIAGVFVKTFKTYAGESPSKTRCMRVAKGRLCKYVYRFRGAYFCAASGDKKNLYSRVVTLAQETNEYFTPDKVTVRASVGDIVTLNMSSASRPCRNQILWTKDGIPIASWTGTLKHSMGVKVEHTGVYSVYCARYELRGAMIRLIVRVCPHGTYGGHCQHMCPVCANGGVCHDITGDCICPPGFKGAGCEEACGPNLVGRECTQFCDETRSDNGCKGKTICTLDPYGCSCATGFHGFKCDQDCPAGKYGADCAQTCGSCKLGHCDRFTGHCKNGCKKGYYTNYCKECNDGWYGKNCQNQCGLCSGNEVCNKSTGHCSECQEGFSKPRCDIPKLRSSATVYDIKSQSATFYWERLGDIHVTTYIVEYRSIDQQSWSNERSATQFFTLKGLQPDTVHQVRIRALIKIHNVEKIGRPNTVVNFTTLCGAPVFRPTVQISPDALFVTVYNTANSVQWKCSKQLRFIVEYKNASSTDWIRYAPDMPYQSGKSIYSQKLPSTSCTQRQVRVKAANKDASSEYSPVEEATTWTTKPHAVRNLTIQGRNSTSIKISWSEPVSNGCPIERYYITHQFLQHLACSPGRSSPESNPISTVATEAHLDDLYPFSKYRIVVWAKTGPTYGTSVFIESTTLDSAPSDPVSHLSKPHPSTTSLVFWWKPPRCNSTNGQITGYEYEFQRLNHFCLEPEGNRSTTTSPIVRINELTPFVNYSMRVRPLVGIHKGPWSDVVTGRTLCSKPPKLIGVNRGFVNSSSVQLLWDIPCPSHGHLTSYEVLINSSTAGTCLHPCSSLLFSDLLANKRYCIKVRAISKCPPRTDQMEGDWSDEIVVQLKESVPGPPSALTATKARHSLVLSWNRPRMQNGQITQYKISWMLLNTYRESSKKLIGIAESRVNPSISSLDFIMKHLIPGSFYQVNVSASTSVGYGPPVSRDFWTNLPELEDASGINLDTQKMTETTVTMSLRPAPIPQQFVSHYTIIVEKKSDSRTKRSDAVVDDSKILDFKNAKKLGQLFYITARLNTSDVEWIRDFVIGDNKTYGGYFNGPLEEGGLYRFQYGYSASNDGENKTHYQYAIVDGKATEAFIEVRNFRREKEVKGRAEAEKIVYIGGSSGGVVVILAALAGFVFYRRQRRKKQPTPEEIALAMPERRNDIQNRSEEDNDPDLEANSEIARCSVAVSYGQRQSLLSTEYSNVNNRVRLDDLPSFVSLGMRVGKLMDEYKMVPTGLLFDHEVASHLDNKPKNRYINIITYDKNRVVLNMVDNDPQSTYINASYIDSYTRSSAFIAAQGPTKDTVVDFWRMIWEKKVRVVVMLTNLVENGKRKCHKYWPESNEPEEFGNFSLSVIVDEQASDITIRKMKIVNLKEDQERTVTQFHFTAWPDHGVPENSGSFWKLHRLVKSEMNSESPAVIHCSAGIGRTGTFILLDILVDQLTQESLVDPLGFLYCLRQQRVNMVQTVDQYEFIYNAILEYLQSGETFIPTAKFDSSFETLLENSENGKRPIEQEYDTLRRLCPSLPADECVTASLPENVGKNRRSDVLPSDRARPVLMSRDKGKSTDYINAVFVNGYRHRDEFLATQIPLPSTVADFWRMMFDHDCHIIVCLSDWSESDDTWGRYWPENGTAQYGQYGVELVSTRTEHNGYIVISTMNLHPVKKDASRKPYQVIQIELKGWPVYQHVPHEDVQASLIVLMDIVERYQQKIGNKTVVVTCLDGFTQSGVFCSFEYLVSKIKVEQGVDVFQSVRHVRYNRPQFICDLEQYTFLYHMAKRFMEMFETYANFQ